MKIVRNAGRDSQVWELQEDNGELVKVFKSKAEAEAAMGGDMPKEEPAPEPEVEVEEDEGAYAEDEVDD
jgi:hypothetical protein